MGEGYRVVPVEVTTGRETWAIEIFKQTFRPWRLPEGINQTLKHNLQYLDTYAEEGDRGRTRCHLNEDFAPHSFTFVMEQRVDVPAEQKTETSGPYKYVYWFDGGLITTAPDSRALTRPSSACVPATRPRPAGL